MASAAEPVPLFQRLTVLRENRGDPNIFKYFEQWRQQDVAVIQSRLRNPDNIASLRRYSDTMLGAYGNGRVTFPKLELAYMLYSIVLTKELTPEDKAFHGELVGTDIERILTYLMGADDVVPEFGEDSIFKGLQFNKRIGCLPFVSETGRENYRNLNGSFGKKLPILALPLTMSSYDGVTHKAPFYFYRHDVGHTLNAGFTEEKIDQWYNYYEQINAIVEPIVDPIIQLQCDIALAEIGHERDFAHKGSINFHENGDITDTPARLIAPGEIFEMCESTISDIMFAYSNAAKVRRLGETCDSYISSDLKKEYLKDTNTQPTEEQLVSLKVTYYNKRSFLRHLVNPDTGSLYTPAEVLFKLGLHEDTQIQHSHITALTNGRITPEMDPESITYNLDTAEEREFDQWYQNMVQYNKLIELTSFCKEQGLVFDKTLEGITAFYQDVGQVFKDNVIPAFLSYYEAAAAVPLPVIPS